MRNAWKGLVFGALTSVAAGIAVDLVNATAPANAARPKQLTR